MRTHLSFTVACALVAALGCSSDPVRKSTNSLLYTGGINIGYVNASRDSNMAMTSFASGTLSRAQANNGNETYTRATCSLTFVSPHVAITSAQCANTNNSTVGEQWPAPVAWEDGEAQPICAAGRFPYSMYRVVADYTRNAYEYNPTVTVTNNDPSTWFAAYQGPGTGYNVDTACCSPTGDENLDPSSDLALVYCDDLTFSGGAGNPQYGTTSFAPGVVYGYLQMEQTTPLDFDGREIYMPWTHESVNPIAAQPNVDVPDQIDTYYTNLSAFDIQGGVPNNYHFLNNAPQLPMLGVPGTEHPGGSPLDRAATLQTCNGALGAPVIVASTNEISGLMDSGDELSSLLCQNPGDHIATKSADRFFVNSVNGGVITAPTPQDAANSMNAIVAYDWSISGAPPLPTYYAWDFNRVAEQIGWNSVFSNPVQFNLGTPTFDQGRNTASIELVPNDELELYVSEGWSYLAANQPYDFGIRVSADSGSNALVEVEINTLSSVVADFYAAAASGTTQLTTHHFTAPVADPGAPGATYWITFKSVTGSGSMALSDISLREVSEPLLFLTANERQSWDRRPAGTNGMSDYNSTRSMMRFGGSFMPLLPNYETLGTQETEAFVGVLYDGERMESRRLGLVNGSYNLNLAVPRYYGSVFADLTCGMWQQLPGQAPTAIQVPCALNTTNATPLGLGVYGGAFLNVVIDAAQFVGSPDAFFIEVPPSQERYRWIEIGDLTLNEQSCGWTDQACSTDADCCDAPSLNYCSNPTGQTKSGGCEVRLGAGAPCNISIPESCQAGLACTMVSGGPQCVVD